MNYQQTIDYLYNALPMFSRMGSVAFKKDLDNIIALCKVLDDPHKKFKSIHVAGTNGKGSVSHMLASILQCHDLKVGLYTSPHLYDFRERIKLNGKMIDEKFVIEFVEKIQPSINELKPSFFEITVAMAFDFFARKKVDVAVIEVGLGGRLDSTNIITPELSVITNIGWDHMNMLGNSLEEIAYEKAGIIKEYVPVVIGERQEKTDSIFEKVAKEKRSAIYFASDEYEATQYKWKKDLLEIEILLKDEDKKIKLETDLTGIYQARNICTALQAWDAFVDHGFTPDIWPVEKGLKKVKKLTGLHGRWEIIHRRPQVVLEVAHNKDGISQMLLHLQHLNYNRLHIILGMVKDKEINEVLRLLPKSAVYYFTQSHIARAMNAASLQQQASAFELYGESYDDVNKALHKAILNTHPDDIVIVCGSIFLVAEVNKKLISKIA